MEMLKKIYKLKNEKTKKKLDERKRIAESVKKENDTFQIRKMW